MESRASKTLTALMMLGYAMSEPHCSFSGIAPLAGPKERTTNRQRVLDRMAELKQSHPHLNRKQRRRMAEKEIHNDA